MSGLYAADGSWNVTVVDGSAFTGTYASDGSVNVVADNTYYGIYHPCGALRVTLTSANVNSLYAPNGSWYVCVSPYVNAAQRITIVSGSFGPPPTGFYYPWAFF